MLGSLGLIALWAGAVPAAEPVTSDAEAFPRNLESYNDADLKKYFNNEVSPGGILAGAVVPTAIVWLIFLVFR